MTFRVVANSTFHQVSVEWTEELGLVDSLVHRYLAEQLAWLRGVNSITLKRYAVWLDVEPRISDASTVGRAIIELLQEDPEFRYALEHTAEPKILEDLKFEYHEEIRVW